MTYIAPLSLEVVGTTAQLPTLQTQVGRLAPPTLQALRVLRLEPTGHELWPDLGRAQHDI